MDFEFGFTIHNSYVRVNVKSQCQTKNPNYQLANSKQYAISRERIEREQNADGTADATSKPTNRKNEG